MSAVRRMLSSLASASIWTSPPSWTPPNWTPAAEELGRFLPSAASRWAVARWTPPHAVQPRQRLDLHVAAELDASCPGCGPLIGITQK